VKTIPLSSIKIRENRQRREFKEDELRQLAESISTHGLFHPITLSVEADGHYLVSGERRLRAITDLHSLGTEFRCDGLNIPTGEVPFVTLGDLGELEREEAELEENVRRVDLNWKDRAAATARLQSLRQRQANRGDRDAPTTASLAVETRGSSSGSTHEATRRELIVAQHLKNPEVAGAKTLDEAFKAVKRTEERSKNEALALRVGTTFTADVHKAINGDSCEWLKQSSAERFDVILTDPPYGMGADSFGDSGGMAAGAHGYEDSRQYFESLMSDFCVHSFRVAKPQAHAYVFCDIDNFFDLRLWMSEAGWDVFRTPLIWHKPNGMRAPWPEGGPFRRYEICLFASKGKRPVTKLYPDLVAYPPDTNLGHAAQKPVDLFLDLLRRSVHPGDTVLDPFSGSGTIFPAAHILKCAATGIELDPASYAIGVKRIEALKAQMELAV